MPKLLIFSILLIVTCLISLSLLTYLVVDHWSIFNRESSEFNISKGPIIWAISLIVIYADLFRTGLKKTTTNQDLYRILAFMVIFIASLYIDPYITLTLLIIAIWYFLSEATDFSRILIVWLFLLLSLPVYSQVNDFLRFMTVVISEGLLRIFGVPVLVQEFYVAVPGGFFFIEDGCSGLRYLTINLILLFIYSLMSRFSLRQFLSGLLVSVGIALLVNWIRVVGIISYANNFGVEDIRGHDDVGWFLYVIALVPFFYLLLKIDNKSAVNAAVIKPAATNQLAIPAASFLIIPILILFWHQWLQ